MSLAETPESVWTPTDKPNDPTVEPDIEPISLWSITKRDWLYDGRFAVINRITGLDKNRSFVFERVGADYVGHSADQHREVHLTDQDGLYQTFTYDDTTGQMTAHYHRLFYTSGSSGQVVIDREIISAIETWKLARNMTVEHAVEIPTLTGE